MSAPLAIADDRCLFAAMHESLVGTQLPRAHTTARPQLAKADTASRAHPLVRPTEPCLAAVLAGRALAAKVTRPGLANPPSPAFRPLRSEGRTWCETEAEEGMGPVRLFRTNSTLTPRTLGSPCGKLMPHDWPWEGCP